MYVKASHILPMHTCSNTNPAVDQIIQIKHTNGCDADPTLALGLYQKYYSVIYISGYATQKNYYLNWWPWVLMAMISKSDYNRHKITPDADTCVNIISPKRYINLISVYI